MTEDEAPQPRPVRYGLWLCVGGAIIAATALGFILIQSKASSRAAVELERKLAQLRKDGVPLTAMQIGAVMPDPDPQRDARVVFQPALAWLPGGPVSTNMPIVSVGSLPRRREELRREVMNEIAAYLTNSQNLVAAMPTNFDGVWFSMGWTNGFTNVTSLPFSEVRRLAQTLALKAFYEGASGNSQNAAESLHSGFGVTRALNGDSLVSTMMRVAVAGLMYASAEQVLNQTKLTDAELLGVQENINPAVIDDFTHACIVERQIVMGYFDAVRTNRTAGRGVKERFSAMLQWWRSNRKALYRDEDYLLYLNVLDERRATLSLTGLERLKRSEQLDSHYKTNSKSQMADAVSGGWTTAIRRAVETRAKLEALKTALAVERYRIAHQDELPDSLAALVPQYLPGVPRDPMDNEPLRFKKLPRGYVIYSIGGDEIDNGGTERTNPYATTNNDVTITVER